MLIQIGSKRVNRKDRNTGKLLDDFGGALLDREGGVMFAVQQNYDPPPPGRSAFAHTIIE